MKRKFLNYTLTSIKQYYPEYDEVKLDELRYGLEAFYLSTSKMIIITALSIILGIFKEMVLMLLIFNILRTTGFGLHATKSWICLLSSSSIFLLLPMISRVIVIPDSVKIMLAIISIVCIWIYAPADTVKRPLIKKRKRDIYKFITTISCIILNITALIVKNATISNLIIFGIYTEIFLILPITYKIFHLSYNNYKNYQLKFD